MLGEIGARTNLTRCDWAEAEKAEMIGDIEAREDRRWPILCMYTVCTQEVIHLVDGIAEICLQP